MPPVDRRHLFLWLAAGTLVLLVVLARLPVIDLVVSGYFYTPGEGFPADRIALVDGFRFLIWDLSILLVLASAMALPLALWRGRPVLRLWPGDWGFILALYLLGSGLLVEGVLKRHWGRARPVNVTEFGGSQLFTPAGQIADQCARNCSFVAGEMAGATALALALALILWRWRDRIGEAAFRLGLALSALQAGLIGLERVASGRHFFSDAVMAALLVLLLAVPLSRLIPTERHPPR